MVVVSEEERLKELREMIIDYWILDSIEWDDWSKYEKRNDYKWIYKEGLNMFCGELWDEFGGVNKKKFKEALKSLREHSHISISKNPIFWTPIPFRYQAISIPKAPLLYIDIKFIKFVTL